MFFSKRLLSIVIFLEYLHEVEHRIFGNRYCFQDLLDLLFKLILSFVYGFARVASDIIDAFGFVTAELFATSLASDYSFEEKILPIVHGSTFV
jgi:hypothetical protein